MTEDEMETVLQLWADLDVKLSALAENPERPSRAAENKELLLRAYAARRKEVWPRSLVWHASQDR